MTKRIRKDFGELSSSAKLNDEKVKYIRKVYDPKEFPLRSLASEFGVSHETIRLVVLRRTWRHVK